MLSHFWLLAMFSVIAGLVLLRMASLLHADMVERLDQETLRRFPPGADTQGLLEVLRNRFGWRAVGVELLGKLAGLLVVLSPIFGIVAVMGQQSAQGVGL